jgi:alpha-amylase/alpha-mannosidase (GH57 family)
MFQQEEWSQSRAVTARNTNPYQMYLKYSNISVRIAILPCLIEVLYFENVDINP